MFQYGLNTTCVISSTKIGVLLSGAPTTTRMSHATESFSTASRRKSGTLTVRYRAGILSGSHRHRSRLSSIVTDPLLNWNVQRVHCLGVDDAIGLDAVAFFEPLYRLDRGGVIDGARIRLVRWIEVALNREPLAERRHDSGLLTGPQPGIRRQRWPTSTSGLRRDRSITHKSFLERAICRLRRLETLHGLDEIVVLYCAREDSNQVGPFRLERPERLQRMWIEPAAGQV